MWAARPCALKGGGDALCRSRSCRPPLPSLPSCRPAEAHACVCALCRYDKSAYAGRGDRAPRPSWPVVEGPLEVLFFEGWMSGFAPVSDAAAAAVDPDLAKVRTAAATLESLVHSAARAAPIGRMPYTPYRIHVDGTAHA